MTNSPVSHRTQLAILSAGLLTFVGILVDMVKAALLTNILFSLGLVLE